MAVAGLKVAGFSVSCRSAVRVAGKGLREAVARGEWRVARINGRNFLAPTRSVRAPGTEYPECRLRGERSG